MQFAGETHDTPFRKPACLMLAFAAGEPADRDLSEPVLARLVCPASVAARATADGLRPALAALAAPAEEPHAASARTARQASAAVR